jgi:hypothetical protein
MTRPSPASETERRDDLMAVRALLDDALVGLRAITDPAVPLRESRDAVAAALEHVYRALASWASYAKVQEEASQALERCREALGALQHRETEDQGALADIALVAQAIGALRSNARVPAEVVLDLPTRRPSGAVPASRDEPRELDVARDVLPPAVPVPLLVDTRTPELDLDAAPTVTIESLSDLER